MKILKITKIKKTDAVDKISKENLRSIFNDNGRVSVHLNSLERYSPKHAAEIKKVAKLHDAYTSAFSKLDSLITGY